jgi:hypothetical protein
MPTHERPRASTLSVVLATLAGSLLLLLALPNVVPVIRAARADGVPGTFVAERLSCVDHLGHETCSWSGTFRPRDGGEVRADVYLYGSDRDSLRPGQRASAVDTGQRARVYPPSGSNEWIVTTGVLVGGLLLFAPVGRRAAGLLGPRRQWAHWGTPDRSE